MSREIYKNIKKKYYTGFYTLSNKKKALLYTVATGNYERGKVRFCSTLREKKHVQLSGDVLKKRGREVVISWLPQIIFSRQISTFSTHSQMKPKSASTRQPL